jgi:dihydroneopterin aldolase
MVTILTAAMLSNENLASSMTAEEMVDASINYMNVIQERLAFYEGSKLHSLERLLDR